MSLQSSDGSLVTSPSAITSTSSEQPLVDVGLPRNERPCVAAEKRRRKDDLRDVIHDLDSSVQQLSQLYCGRQLKKITFASDPFDALPALRSEAAQRSIKYYINMPSLACPEDKTMQKYLIQQRSTVWMSMSISDEAILHAFLAYANVAIDFPAQVKDKAVAVQAMHVALKSIQKRISALDSASDIEDKDYVAILWLIRATFALKDLPAYWAHYNGSLVLLSRRRKDEEPLLPTTERQHGDAAFIGQELGLKALYEQGLLVADLSQSTRSKTFMPDLTDMLERDRVACDFLLDHVEYDVSPRSLSDKNAPSAVRRLHDVVHITIRLCTFLAVSKAETILTRGRAMERLVNSVRRRIVSSGSRCAQRWQQWAANTCPVALLWIALVNVSICMLPSTIHRLKADKAFFVALGSQAVEALQFQRHDWDAVHELLRRDYVWHYYFNRRCVDAWTAIITSAKSDALQDALNEA